MKNKKIMLIMLMACIMLFATACGETKKTVSKSKADVSEDKEEKKEKKKEKDKKTDKKSDKKEEKKEETPKKTEKTLEDYKSSDDWKKLEKEASKMGGNGISLIIDAKGNTLIYICTFDDGVLGDNPDYDALGEQLEAALDDAGAEEQFKAIAEAAADELGINGVSVEVIYRADGRTLVDRLYE